MKKKFQYHLCCAAVLALALTACSGGGQTAQTTTAAKNQETQLEEEKEIQLPENQESDRENESHADTVTGTDSTKAESGESNILIAYFSIPEDIELDGVNAVSGASVVVKDGEKLGNVQYIAQTIQEAIGGELFRIETVKQYPLDHDPLVDQAAEEQDEEARPELAVHLENIDQYDVIFLGYPNWWGDLPMPLYTFLEEMDLSGKTIIPFCPHGGSGFSRTEATIAGLQPDAQVREGGLSISRNDVADSRETVLEWVNSLGL